MAVRTRPRGLASVVAAPMRVCASGATLASSREAVQGAGPEDIRVSAKAGSACITGTLP
jgi:hypothetical protein